MLKAKKHKNLVNWQNNNIALRLHESSTDSDDKILIRVITEAKLKSGHVGVDTVRKMNDILKKQNYARQFFF